MKDLIPLSLGNFWKYSRYSSINGMLENIANEVISERNVNNNPIYLIKEFGDEFWVRNSREGQVSIELNDNEEFVQENIFLKKPEVKGSFQYDFKVDIYDENIHILVSKDYSLSRITVNQDVVINNKLGEFKCLHYIIEEAGDDNNFVIQMFVNPDIGIVRHIVNDDGEEIISDIIEYQIR